MWKKKKTQVLVVGAGPVGMTAAICLIKEGIDFEIVDKSPGLSHQSKACLLSPETLEFLNSLDLLDAVLEKGIRIKTIQLYAGGDRLANLGLSGLPTRFPFILSIPQSDLEHILHARLALFHKNVLWNHRVTAINPIVGGLSIDVDRSSERMMGYAVMHEERMVDQSFTFNSKVVLAADGFYSLVRRLQKINYEPVGGTMGTMLFEVKRNPREDAVLKLGFNGAGASVYIPLPHGIGRYGFTYVSPVEVSVDRDKEHEYYEEDADKFPELTDAHFSELLHDRMPYQSEKVGDITWRASVPFGVRLAERIWANGIFLVGDAARSGFPLGAKSLNLGLPEAGKVVESLHPYLDSGDETQLEKVAQAIRTEWEDLSSLVYFSDQTGTRSSSYSVDPHLILQALPLGGKDLDYAASKLSKLITKDQFVGS